MDLRNVFRRMSERLMTEFRLSAEINHAVGKGSFREDSFKNFLTQYLPNRYAVGSGEVITAQNAISGQLDVIIYDPFQCPRLIINEAHSVFPVESVYGSISVKSHLDSTELADAHANIVSFKRILDRSSFQSFPHSGMVIGMAAPMPVTGIFAFAANRSLEAIKDQLVKLNSNLEDKSLKPDFVAVLELGLIAHQQPLRGDFNVFNIPTDDFGTFRKTGRQTLMKLYLDVLRELNALTLRPLDLRKYINMPRRVGNHLLGRYGTFAKQKTDKSEDGKVLFINEKGIKEILNNSVSVSVRKSYQNRFGCIPEGAEKLCNLDEEIFEYNPQKKPPISLDNIKMINGRTVLQEACFQAIDITIDSKVYVVDLYQMADCYFDEDKEMTVDELLYP